MHNDDQDLMNFNFRDVNVGDPFQVIDENDCKSDWVKINNSEAIGFDEVREFSLYDVVYIDMIRNRKDVEAWENSPEGKETLRWAIIEAQIRNEVNGKK